MCAAAKVRLLVERMDKPVTVNPTSEFGYAEPLTISIWEIFKIVNQTILKEIQHLIYRNDLDIKKAPKEVVTLHMRVSKSSSAHSNGIKLKSDYINSKQQAKTN